MLLIVGYMRLSMTSPLSAWAICFFRCGASNAFRRMKPQVKCPRSANRSSAALAARLQNWSDVELTVKIVCCKYETLFHSRAECAMLGPNLGTGKTALRKGAKERDACHG